MPAWVTCVGGKSGSVTYKFAKQSRNPAEPTSPRSRRCAFFFSSEVIGHLVLVGSHRGIQAARIPGMEHAEIREGFWDAAHFDHTPAGWRRRSYAASVAACASASLSTLPEFGVPQTRRNHIRFSPAGSRVGCSAGSCSAGSLRVATPLARLEPLTMLGS